MLPGQMRGAASLGYLLARTSDTLADSATIPQEDRRGFLEQFRASVAGIQAMPRWPAFLINSVPNANERKLLEISAEMITWLDQLPAGETRLVREVVETIISGQLLDLRRFADADPANPIALASDEAFEDYAWRVAGCVGAFWTRLGFLTMGNRFSISTPTDLLERGITYGKALQVVNILRDVAADLALGRCYLPVNNPQDRDEILECHARWLAQTDTWLKEGRRYSATLKSRRLRAATVLPAMIASQTLESMRRATWEQLQTRIKVPRSVVYRSILRAYMSTPSTLSP